MCFFLRCLYLYLRWTFNIANNFSKIVFSNLLNLCCGNTKQIFQTWNYNFYKLESKEVNNWFCCIFQIGWLVDTNSSTVGSVHSALMAPEYSMYYLSSIAFMNKYTPINAGMHCSFAPVDHLSILKYSIPGILSWPI